MPSCANIAARRTPARSLISFSTILGTDTSKDVGNSGASVATYADGFAFDGASSYPTSIDTSLLTNRLRVWRPGFDQNAQPCTWRDDRIVMSRMRRPWQNGDGNDPSIIPADGLRGVFDDYIYSTDGIDPRQSVVNNSAKTSPIPIANWATPHRQVVGNTLTGEIVAAHRDARFGSQIACVVVTATDGTTTVTTTVSTPTKSTRSSDQHPVIVYAWSLDITTLTDNHLVTVNAKVYPWIGGAAAVADSAVNTSGGGTLREFTARYYLKNTTLAASPVYACVSSGGNDATGVFSTTQATAIATPFLTIGGVINKINTTSPNTKADGIIILVDSGTFALPSTASTTINQNIACLTITRKPGVARASAIVTFGTSNFRPRLSANLTSPITTGCVRFNDITINRTGASGIQGESASSTRLECQWDDVTFDNGSNNFNVCSTSDQYLYGVVASNMSNATFNTSANGQSRIIRGLSASSCQLDGWLVLGCALSATSVTTSGTGGANGAIVAFNTFNSAVNGSTLIIGGTADCTGFAVLQNVFEYISTSVNPMVRITADGDTGNVDHIVFHQNTLVGYIGYGKANSFYEDGATRRHTRLISSKGNFLNQRGTKSDVFVGWDNNGTPNPTEAPYRIENWAFNYGVGCQGEIYNHGFTLDSMFRQNNPGLGCVDSTSQTTPTVDYDTYFTTYAATRWSGTATNPTAGAGGGTYSWKIRSAAYGLVNSAVLNYDLAGSARSMFNDSASAYVSP